MFHLFSERDIFQQNPTELIHQYMPRVKAGDTVEKGQVLVSGGVPVYDESQSVIDYQIYDSSFFGERYFPAKSHRVNPSI